MFFGHKLDPLLKSLLNNNVYSKYRVLIEYGSIKGSIEKRIKSGSGQLLYNIDSAHCICAFISKNTILRLIELPEVRFLTLDEEAFLCSKNVLYANGIFLDNSGFKMLKDEDLSGKDVYVGVIDSGVYPHVDLSTPKAKVETFIDLISGLHYPYDDNGHGTFISGIICGNSSNRKVKARGIAPGSRLIMVKAFNKYGIGYASSTLAAFDALLNISDTMNLKVICAPFSVNTLNPHILALYERIFNKLKSKNIVVVVPTGNKESTEDTIKGIGLSSNVITVGGINTDSSYKISDYSCCGSNKVLKKPDFVAASEHIISLNSDTSYISELNGEKLYPHGLSVPYTVKSGTSLSCAFISGVCALLFQLNPAFTFDDIYTLLKINSIMINDKKWRQGHGYINIEKLINLDFKNPNLVHKKKKKD